MLKEILQKQFKGPQSPRGIIFTRTRQSAHSLLLWLQQQPSLQTVDIRAQLLIGAGNSSQSTPMTQMTQVWALGKGAEHEGGDTEMGTDCPQAERRELAQKGVL